MRFVASAEAACDECGHTFSLKPWQRSRLRCGRSVYCTPECGRRAGSRLGAQRLRGRKRPDQSRRLRVDHRLGGSDGYQRSMVAFAEKRRQQAASSHAVLAGLLTVVDGPGGLTWITTCTECGEEFSVAKMHQRANIARRGVAFCGTECARAHMRRTLRERAVGARSDRPG